MSHEILWALLGFACGFVVGYLVNDAIRGQKQEEALFEATEQNIERDAELQELRFREEQRQEAKKLVESYGYSYTTVVKKSEEGPTEDDDEEENIPCVKPFVISEEEYEDEYLNATRETLTYYQKDGVLTDSDDEPILDVNELIGEDASFEIEHTDQTDIYVYNDEYDTKYDIIIDKDTPFIRFDDDD